MADDTAQSMADFLSRYQTRREHYILKGREAVPVDLLTWARWFETSNRIIARTYVGRWYASTVFLGLNHAWDPDSPPQIFETMIFGGPLDQDYQTRCSTLRSSGRDARRSGERTHGPRAP